MRKTIDELENEIKLWIDDYAHHREKEESLLKLNIEQAKDLATNYLYKYYDAPTNYLMQEKDLIVEYHKKIFGFYISILLAITGFLMSLIYFEIFIKGRNLIFNILTLFFPQYWTTLFFTIIFIVIIAPIGFYILLRYIIFSVIRNFIIERSNYGDIQRFVIEKIMEEKRERE